ncbi:MAG: hypothetical protein ACKVOL_16610 [Novosphingobium sp.]
MASSRFDTPCRIEIEQTAEQFHAHVRLAGDIELRPGDQVRVHGAPIRVDFGQSIAIERMATVTRAGPLAQLWIKLAAYFDLTELYEVSFTPGRPS